MPPPASGPGVQPARSRRVRWLAYQIDQWHALRKGLSGRAYRSANGYLGLAKRRVARAQTRLAIAGRAHQVHRVQERPALPRRLHAAAGATAPGHHPGRSSRLPLRRAQPPKGTQRPSRELPRLTNDQRRPAALAPPAPLPTRPAPATSPKLSEPPPNLTVRAAGTHARSTRGARLRAGCSGGLLR
jgi:hypothetical protein